ncbi:hypothetical protein ACG33_12290 [Steroidobacter denitrificans]|uniref:ABC transporter ATP-binding protein n=1 Tax=Steroidobacter denitrificans TaxID=465721 RepID=A0A127FBR3_STEDE|nr:hypothetical protein ACG33_12290 [Steroidobacter denitrificans]
MLFRRAADRSVRRDLRMVILLAVAGACAAALTPLVLKFLLDVLERAGEEQFAVTALALLYAVGQYSTRLIGEWRLYRHGCAEQRVCRAIGRRVFEHLLCLPLHWHVRGRLGSIGQLAEQGVQGCRLLLSAALCTVFPVLLELGLIAVVLVRLEHEIYLAVLLAATAAYVLAFQHGAADIEGPARRIAQTHIAAHAMFTDSLLNCEAVKCFNAEAAAGARYRAALRAIEAAWRGFFSRRAANGVLLGGIFAACLGATVIFAARDVLRGAMTFGDVVLVHAYVIRLVAPLEMLGLALRDSAQAFAYVERLLGVLAERPEAPFAMAVADERTVPMVRGDVEFDGVEFSYEEGAPALRSISFRIDAGDTVAIVGGSGAGKSTLIRLLLRLYSPSQGTIRIDGMPVEQMPLAVLRRKIAVVPQDVILFHDTIARNIAVGRDAPREEIIWAARLANIHDRIMSLPQAYDTPVGERGVRLSGGERQRIAIARAVLGRARIIVLDEATASLDGATERGVLSELQRITAGSTVLAITHRLATVTTADRILVLDGGMLVEQGSHAELLQCRGVYAGLWHAQHRQGFRRDVTQLGAYPSGTR